MPLKRNLSLLAAILLLAAVCFAGYLLANRGAAAYAAVSVDGTEIARFDLRQETEYRISGYGGGQNRLVIRGGEAWIEEASCPDKLCVRQGRIRRGGETIICLPNRVVVEIIEG